MNEKNNKLKFINTLNGDKVIKETITSDDILNEVLPHQVEGLSLSNRIPETLNNSMPLENIVNCKTIAHTLLDFSIEGKYIIDIDGHCIYINKACLEILKYSNEKDLLGKDIHPIIHHTNQDGSVLHKKDCLICQVITNGENICIDNEVMWKADGTSFPTKYWSSPIWQDGKILGAVVSIFDITKRKQSEKALRESEEKFRELVESSSDWIWEVNRDGVYTYVSPQIENILGYKPEELLGKTPFDLMPFEEGDRAGRIFNDLKIKGKSIFSEENINLHKDGSRVVLETSGVAVLDEDGLVKGYRGIDRDITKRKQLEFKLSEERKRAQTYLDIANVMFVALDKSSIITLANQKACEVLGYTEKEIIGQNWIDNFIPQHLRKSIKEVANQVIRGEIKPVEYFENAILTKSGLERIIAWHNTVLRDSKGLIIGHLSSGEDITERKKAENALHDSNTALKKILKTIEEEKKEQMLSVQAHVNRAVLPLVRKIEIGANDLQSNYISLLIDSLETVVSPYVGKLEARFVNLSPREIEICKFVKDGMSSKEIALHLNISKETVRNQRKSIRKKLKIDNKKINLTSFLKSI